MINEILSVLMLVSLVGGFFVYKQAFKKLNEEDIPMGLLEKITLGITSVASVAFGLSIIWFILWSLLTTANLIIKYF